MKTIGILFAIVVMTLLASLYYFFTATRSDDEIIQTARNEIKIFLKYEWNSEYIYNELSGPLIEEDNAEFSHVSLYKILDWGDTAKISARVYKSALSCQPCKSWFSKLVAYREPQIGMNEQWLYLTGAHSNFSEIFGEANIVILTERDISFKESEDADTVNISYLVSDSLLSYFIFEGFFDVLYKSNEYVIIDFYEPIALMSNPTTRDSAETRVAKVFSRNSNSTLTIFPIPRPRN